MRTRSSLTATAVLGAVTVLTAGCLSDEGGGGGGSSNTSNTIEVMYAFTGGQEEGFKAEVDAWAAENDVTIKYAQTGNFNQLINTRVQGNDAPDVALFPQPGIMKDMAEPGPAGRPVRRRRLERTRQAWSRASSRPARSTGRSTRCR